MKRTLLMILILVALCLSSCAPRQSDPLAYQKGSISAEVSLEKNGTRLGAVVKLGPMADTPRDAEIVFTAPDSIKGLTIERHNGSTNAKLGELSITPDERALFLAELFSLDGLATGAKTENGLTHLTISTAKTDYELTLDADGNPRKISGQDFSLEIIWLESTK